MPFHIDPYQIGVYPVFEQAATFLTLTPLMLGLSLCAAARDLWEIDGATLY